MDCKRSTMKNEGAGEGGYKICFVVENYIIYILP